MSVKQIAVTIKLSHCAKKANEVAELRKLWAILQPFLLHAIVQLHLTFKWML